MQLGQAHLGQGRALQIAHQDEGQEDFVGREAQNQGGQDDPVDAEQLCEGVERRTDQPQQRLPVNRAVCQQPDHQPCRGGHRRGAPQHKEGAVQHRADNHLADLGAAVGRQLQRKGGGLAFERGFGEQPGGEEGGQNREDDQPGQHKGAQQRGAGALPHHHKHRNQ